MKRLITLSMVMALCACNSEGDSLAPSEPLFASDNAAVTEVQDVATRGWNSCTGEYVDMVGSMYTVSQLLTSANGGMRMSEKYRLVLSGTGLTSGTKYESSESGHFDLDMVPGFASSFVIRFRMQSQGGDDNTAFDMVIVYRMNLDGKVTRDITSVTSDCR